MAFLAAVFFGAAFLGVAAAVVFVTRPDLVLFKTVFLSTIAGAYEWLDVTMLEEVKGTCSLRCSHLLCLGFGGNLSLWRSLGFRSSLRLGYLGGRCLLGSWFSGGLLCDSALLSGGRLNSLLRLLLGLWCFGDWSLDGELGSTRRTCLMLEAIVWK